MIRDNTEVLVLPSPILVEVDQLLNARGYAAGLLTVLDNISNGSYRVEDLIATDYLRVRDLCARYEDSDIGFVDAAVLAIAERLGEPKLATLDHRHFSILRPRHVDALQLLP